MKPIKIKEILSIINADSINIDIDNEEITKIEIDSRNISKNSLFVPIKGENFDGHNFIISALKNGAEFSLCSREHYDLNKEKLNMNKIILVDDTVAAMQKIAKYILNNSGAKVIAITGSTGKTTTKNFIYEVLKMKYSVSKTIGNFNNHIGLPLTIFNMKEDTEIVILEMGMSNLNEIKKLVEIATPSIAIITNIGMSHIGQLGSQEKILEAKMEITSYFNKESLLILNGEDEKLLNEYKKDTKYSKVIVAINKDADYIIEEISSDDNFMHEYSIKNIKNNKVINNIELGVLGYHNIINSAFAVILGEIFEVPQEMIKGAIFKYSGEKMRLTIFNHPKGFKIINDAYNASIESMKSSLDTIKNIKGNKKILFLGDMFEMGEYSIEGHRIIGDYIDLDTTSMIVTIGEYSEYIGERLLERGFNTNRVVHVNNFEQASKFLLNELSTDDVLLIKGSRGMAMETILQYLE